MKQSIHAGFSRTEALAGMYKYPRKCPEPGGMSTVWAHSPCSKNKEAVCAEECVGGCSVLRARGALMLPLHFYPAALERQSGDNRSTFGADPPPSLSHYQFVSLTDTHE
ncbi:hypothetical protein GOODEAATRI_010352 [Goodea atripinnis]|uniref:Uncharacterized protein n=1 Tax=Goodea atripinnis TaxID=208336 RepID=A0ABV0PMD1_9TELE